ncbi:hypothetical protein VTI74DRAFT_11523 [Chaetomium olivicolor]
MTMDIGSPGMCSLQGVRFHVRALFTWVAAGTTLTLIYRPHAASCSFRVTSAKKSQRRVLCAELAENPQQTAILSSSCEIQRDLWLSQNSVSEYGVNRLPNLGSSLAYEADWTIFDNQNLRSTATSWDDAGDFLPRDPDPGTTRSTPLNKTPPRSNPLQASTEKCRRYKSARPIRRDACPRSRRCLLVIPYCKVWQHALLFRPQRPPVGVCRCSFSGRCLAKPSLRRCAPPGGAKEDVLIRLW